MTLDSSGSENSLCLGLVQNDVDVPRAGFGLKTNGMQEAIDCMHAFLYELYMFAYIPHETINCRQVCV